jgi:hypothetical protein
MIIKKKSVFKKITHAQGAHTMNNNNNTMKGVGFPCSNCHDIYTVTMLDLPPIEWTTLPPGCLASTNRQFHHKCLKCGSITSCDFSVLEHALQDK